MNTPKKKYDFESRMLFAFTNGIKVGQRLQEGDCEKEIAYAKKQFCRELNFEYFGGRDEEDSESGHAPM